MRPWPRSSALWRLRCMVFAPALWVVSVLSGIAATDLAETFYAPDKVQVIRLEIQAQNLERMQRALPERIWVPASFEWNDQKHENVGIRYKGNSSSAPNSPHKRSFLVDFSEFRAGQRFLGLRHVALDNGIQFGSLFSERVITDALRDLNVKVSRCNYAQVFLNGTNIGVYVNVERIDKPFLERSFPDGNGPLFKVDEGGPGADLREIGDDPDLYRRAFELQSGNKSQSFGRLQEFIHRINSPDLDGAEFGKIFDVEPFLKITAVMLFAGAFDQYTGWNPHNYYLYQNPADGRWTYIPWDLDVGFADRAFGQVPVLDGWHAAWPAPVPGRPLMERLLSEKSLLQRYREQARMILERCFKPEVLVPKLRDLHAQIRTELAQDPYPARRATVASDTSYADIVATMERFIRARYALALEQLDRPGDHPAFKPPQASRDEGPSPGPASADAPSKLHATKVTGKRVELAWTDNAEGEMAYVVQRSAGADTAAFVNAIGQPGNNVTNAVDVNVQPGMSYRYRVYAVKPTPQGPCGTGVSNTITVEVPER